MRRRLHRFVPASLLVPPLLVLTVLPALAAGTITGITASPDPAAVNQAVTATVQGKGSCNALSVEFGDGTAPAALAPVDFNNQVNVSPPAHTYSAAGTYTIKAIPGKGCEGQASSQLVVKAGAPPPPAKGGGAGTTSLKLCQMLDKCQTAVAKGLPAIPVSTPAITPEKRIIWPGSQLIIKGSGFGKTGWVKIHGDLGERQLIIKEWHQTWILAEVPGNITGVQDQPVVVRVYRNDKAESNDWTVELRALKEVKLLPANYVKVVSCATQANHNSCNSQVKNQMTSIATNAAWVSCDGNSICGYHERLKGSSLYGMTGQGTDVYEISLANGWKTLASKTVGGSVLGSLTPPPIVPAGLNIWKPEYKWSIPDWEVVQYFTTVVIVGPKGVPYK